MRNNKKFLWSKGFVFFIIFLPALFFFPFIVMLLWNAVLPAVLHVTTVTYWQAFGILILSKILFGGFNKRHWGPDRRMNRRFANMSPEEREQFKAEWKEKCNRWRGGTDTPLTAAE